MNKNNKKPKKIIFIKDSKSGAIKHAMDMDLYIKQRQEGRMGSASKTIGSAQFLIGVPPSQKTQYRKNCCGRKS